jgi:hypothetical protein
VRRYPAAVGLTTLLLSPADLRGRRASVLLRPDAAFPLAVALREGRASLGQVLAFVSQLYFRGKLTYAGRFGSVVRVIVPGRGLIDPGMRVATEHVHAFAQVEVDPRTDAYRAPLIRDARVLAAEVDGPVVLLGSIATGKYVEPLSEVLGERLAAPRAFVGRGDMSRGSMLLRAAEVGRELAYAPVAELVRRG